MRRNPSDLDFKPAGRPRLGQGRISIRRGVTIVLVAFVVSLKTGPGWIGVRLGEDSVDSVDTVTPSTACTFDPSGSCSVYT